MACLHNLHFALLAFFTFTNAIPFHSLRVTSETSNPSRLAKRTNPILGKAIDVNDAARGGKLVARQGLPTTGAFSNAQQLLTYALFEQATAQSLAITSTREIAPNSRPFFFLKLAGNPANQHELIPEGATELGQITFQGIDTPDAGDDDPGCEKPGTNMYTDYYETGGPVVVVCEDAWVTPDRDDLTCNEIGDTLSDEMIILGHLVLHEYTHWDWLLTHITGGEVVDIHGPDKAN
ncbi:hypothetical protein EPUS_01196 [Endocarpon pusillum Z07020]|uniref:Lysine-specific metallo-endopeptidase domain-containing protein n=1 Tax=Endocarpon pusillum (strain Z07020 / HMAS-L-300199) TaxID=1263415 RepID=U1HYA0_ENDPU|nr:uncharacterized protein EPUS_01196 [Endocarpon pusillum Z07020]ERF75830.1 hypothetical protein EPUS_01196 [Endocarpon pusillum Z07020]